MIEEKTRKTPSGFLALVVLVVVLALDAVLFVLSIAGKQVSVPLMIVSIVLFPLVVFLFRGLFAVPPNEARVLQLFGNYVGTVRTPGLRYTNPLYSRRRVSVRVRNFETERSKVNDTDGNPIEMAAVVVWKVADTAEATFEVDDYVNFVHVQSESAVRNLATRYPYDTHEKGQLSLRGDTEEIAHQLKTEIQGRLDTAGVEVLEARITHLAYAPEIASYDRSGVRCQVSGVRRQVSGVRCQVSGVRCQVSGVRCRLSGVRCRVSVVSGETEGFSVSLS